MQEINELSTLPKRIAGKLFGKLVSVLWKEFVAGGGAISGYSRPVKISSGDYFCARCCCRLC